MVDYTSYTKVNYSVSRDYYYTGTYFVVRFFKDGSQFDCYADSFDVELETLFKRQLTDKEIGMNYVDYYFK